MVNLHIDDGCIEYVINWVAVCWYNLQQVDSNFAKLCICIRITLYQTINILSILNNYQLTKKLNS